MKLFLKILMWIVILFILFVFFFFPILPSNKARTAEQDVFCQTHGCGILIPITTFEYLKNSIKNL